MSGINWELSSDLRSVTMTVPTQPPTKIEFPTSTVEEILRNLGSMRASMRPETPRDFAFGQTVSAVTDPIWRCEPDAMLGHSLLHMRDPKFGWLHYLLPPSEATELARVLRTQAELQPQSPPANKVN